MATSESGIGRKFLVATLVIASVSVLWIVASGVLTPTHHRKTSDDDSPVCCDVIYENQLDLKYFAEMCHRLLNANEHVRRGSRSPAPPGTLERCRLKILEVCQLDINDLTAKSKPPNKYRTETKPQSMEDLKANLSLCLEKQFHLGADTSRKPLKESHLPGYMRQERSHRLGFKPLHHHHHHHNHQPSTETKKPEAEPKKKSGPSVSQWPKVAPKPEPTKANKVKSFLLTLLYKIGLVSFFLYSVAKVFVKVPKMEAKSLSNGGHNHANGEAHNDGLKAEAEDKKPEESVEEVPELIPEPLNELAEHLKQIIQQDSTKMSVLSLSAKAEVPPKEDTTPAQEGEVSNIILEKAVPADSQILVAESQCLTHTSVEHIDGWSECEESPIVVTGKMTISLQGNDQAVVIDSNQSHEDENAERNSPTPTYEDEEDMPSEDINGPNQLDDDAGESNYLSLNGDVDGNEHVAS